MSFSNRKNSSGKDLTKSSANVPVTVIQPTKGWTYADLKELIEYRDLFYSLVKRNISALYAQTVLGLLWAVIQPLVQIVIFTIIFGKVAKVSSDGVPYFLFSTVAIIPWNYMS
ncbi:MAG: wzm, partial [Proteobacteria bacterium]|nr:wzm [Pseudomonadota bacterium]